MSDTSVSEPWKYFQGLADQELGPDHYKQCRIALRHGNDSKVAELDEAKQAARSRYGRLCKEPTTWLLQQEAMVCRALDVSSERDKPSKQDDAIKRLYDELLQQAIERRQKLEAKQDFNGNTSAKLEVAWDAILIDLIQVKLAKMKDDNFTKTA